MEISQKTLSNGIKTVFINCPGHQAATTQIWFRTGSALESESEQGIAHFLEHMFFKGSVKRPQNAIAHEVESFGGEINAFTSFDYTCYYINTPNAFLETSTEILLDMVSNPLFAEEELIPERDVVFEEYLRTIDNPGQYSFKMIQDTTFLHGYTHSILGTENSIKKFTREQLLSFRKRFYNKENSILVIAGDLKNTAQIEEIISRFELPSGEHSDFKTFELQQKPVVSIHNKEVRMAQLSITIDGIDFSAEHACAEDLVMNCLGHGETSRLYEGLVLDSSMANSASASTMFMSKGGSHFFKFVFPCENYKTILQKAISLLSNLFDKGFEDWEIQKIKNQYLASKIYERESIEALAFTYGHSFAQTGDIYADDQFLERLKNTKLDDVNRAFRSIMQRPIHLSLQLPKEEKIAKYKKELQTFSLDLHKIAKKHIKNSDSKCKITESKFDKQISLIKIKPGIQLLYRQNTMTPTFVFHSYIKGGLTEETKKNNGIYSLLSSMFTKGYDKVSYEAIKKFLEDRSASISGFAGKNAYGLMLHGLTSDMPQLLDHYFGSLYKPTFPEKHLAHEKKMILRALESQKEDPVKQCFATVSQMMFDKHPYALNMLGEKSSIQKIKPKDLNSWHKNALNKKEILFTYCGDLPLADVLNLVKERIELLPSRLEKKVIFKKFTAQKRSHHYINFDREQTQLFVGIPTPKLNNKETLYLKILTAHLSGQSSELFSDIRDKRGLCYAVQPIHFNALEGGYFGIYMATGSEKVTEANQAVLEIIHRMIKHGLSETDFERIKRMLEGQNQINIQSNDDYAGIYSVPTLQGLGLDFHHVTHNAVKNMKCSEFNKGIKALLKGTPFKTVVVGRKDFVQ